MSHAITIHLPPTAALDSVRRLLAYLAAGDAPGVDEIRLDMAGVRYYEPTAIAVCLAKVARWRDVGKHVTVENHLSAQALSFLSRVDFFKELGIEVPDTRLRHDPSGRFVPVQRIRFTTDCDKLAREISSCVMPGDSHTAEQLRYLIQYAVGEVVKNCQQHSGATGFLAAQFYPANGLVQIGMADAGMGILESYRCNGAPGYREGMTDRDMIEESLKPRSSSKTHRPHPSPYGGTVNQGIGLSMCRQLTVEAAGDFLLCSGAGFIAHDAVAFGTARPVTLQAGFQGVVCGLTFCRAALQNCDYTTLLDEVKEKLGLKSRLTPPPTENLFQP